MTLCMMPTSKREKLAYTMYILYMNEEFEYYNQPEYQCHWC